MAMTPEEEQARKARYAAKRAAWYQANKVHADAVHHKWIKRNPERRKATRRAWYAANRAHRAAYRRKWCLANKDRIAAINQRYQAKRKVAEAQADLDKSNNSVPRGCYVQSLSRARNAPCSRCGDYCYGDCLIND